MKELFMQLLIELRTFGKLVSANLYRNGLMSSFEVETDDGTYIITITKDAKKGEAENED
jgi:hypothetical protein